MSVFVFVYIILSIYAIDISPVGMLFLIHISNMDLCNQGCCLSRWQAVRLSCVAKTCKVEHCVPSFQPNLFIHAILISTVDVYHFMSRSVTLTLAGGYNVS